MFKFFTDPGDEGVSAVLFVWLCIGIVTLSLCLLALGLFDVSVANVVVFGITVFVALVVVQGHWQTRRDMRTLKQHALQMTDYESEIDRRIDYIASIVERDGGAAPDELAKRLRAVNREIVQLGERVSALEGGSKGGSGSSTAADAPLEAAEPRAEPVPPASSAGDIGGELRGSGGLALPSEVEPETEQRTGTDDAVSRHASKRELEREDAARFRKAISGDRLAFHLVPIVTLPDRQPIAYEAVMRLKGTLADGGEAPGWTETEQLLAHADRHGLRPLLERKTLYSAAQMSRSVIAMGKRMRLFAPLAVEQLRDERGFEEVALFLESSGSLRSDLVLEVSQRAFRSLSGEARQRIGLVAEAGFSLALRDVTDLAVDAATLRGLGFTHLRMPVNTLREAKDDSFVMRLASHRIECVVMDVANDADLQTVLQRDVGMAQGSHLEGPRAVKADLLRGAPGTREPRERALAS